jgi:uncharacterized protein (TIGR00369 family)
MPTMLDRIRIVQRGELAPAPIAALIGFELTAIEPGQAVIEFEATERHANPMGTLHGGVLCDVADAAMGMAWAATLGEGETFTTLELQINFVKPVWTGKLTATGRVVGPAPAYTSVPSSRRITRQTNPLSPSRATW